MKGVLLPSPRRLGDIGSAGEAYTGGLVTGDAVVGGPQVLEPEDRSTWGIV